MFTLKVTYSIDVKFAATSLHVDNRGIVWARLGNGKLAYYDPSTNEKEVSSYRIKGVAWSGDHATFVDDTYQLVSYDLASKQFIDKPDLKGGTGPICLGAKGNIFACNAERVFEISSDGSTSPLFSVDYNIMSVAVSRDELWVGGNGIDVYDLSTGRLQNMESGRNLPVLQIAISPEANLVATAGGAICFYNSRRELLTDFGSSFFRCQFSRSNILFTCAQEGNVEDPLHWSYSQVLGQNMCVFSDCAGFHCYGEVGNEKVVVSGFDARLYFLDVTFEDGVRKE